MIGHVISIIENDVMDELVIGTLPYAVSGWRIEE